LKASTSEAQTPGINPQHLQKALQVIKKSTDESLSEREYLTILLASKLVAADDEDEHTTALLIQAALLAETSLADRLLDAQEPSEEIEEFFITFAEEARKLISSPAWIRFAM
jgi:hypothetical protein